MASRLHKLGTIFSRLDGLVRKGAIQKTDIPIWYDLYYRFPPDHEPSYSQEAPNIQVQDIFYSEDIIRAKLHKLFSKNLGLVNLSDAKETNSQKWIKIYQDLESKGMSEKEVLKNIEQMIQQPLNYIVGQDKS